MNTIALTGFIMLVIMVFALIRLKVLPVTVFSILPLIGALCLGHGFKEIMDFYAAGMKGVFNIAMLFIGSITFFGVMDEVGLFERPINYITKKIRPNTFVIYCATIFFVIISHLDGSGVTTLLVTVPATLPIIKKLRMRVVPYNFIITISIAVMNLLPWGGPLGRAAAVVGCDVMELYLRVLPVQIFGIVFIFFCAYLQARYENSHGYGAKVPAEGADLSSAITVSEEEKMLRKENRYWLNVAITAGVLGMLFAGVPSIVHFFVGTAIALPVNYYAEGDKFQAKRIAAQAGKALPMIVTIVGAGMLLGVMNGTGMIEQMATVLAGLMPASLGKYLHIFFGIIGIPLTIVFEADSMNYGILPVVAKVGELYGVSSVRSALAIAIAHNSGVGMCLTSGSVYFALGLMGLEYTEVFKHNFWKYICFGTVLILFAAVIGVI